MVLVKLKAFSIQKILYYQTNVSASPDFSHKVHNIRTEKQIRIPF